MTLRKRKDVLTHCFSVYKIVLVWIHKPAHGSLTQIDSQLTLRSSSYIQMQMMTLGLLFSIHSKIFTRSANVMNNVKTTSEKY